MIIQPKQQQQQNQSNRECHHLRSSEDMDDIRSSVSINQSDINFSNGINKDRLEQKPLPNGLTSDYLNNNTSIELVERYKQSVASSNRAYHSTETIEEALSPPWALHYDMKRQVPQPNIPSNSTDMPISEEAPRRLKSAPVARSEPAAAILTIPEPRFIIPLVPVIITNPVPLSSSESRPKTRALSARARLNTPNSNENNLQQQQQQQEIKSSKKLSDDEIQDIFKRVYGDNIEQSSQPPPPIQIIYTQPKPKPSQAAQPVYVYKKAASWCGSSDVSSSTSSLSIRTSIDTKSVQLNPHYRHRPPYISVKNNEKKPVLRAYSPTKRSSKHQRRDHYSPTKRNTPLLAKTPLQQKPRITLEINGLKLKYDPKITLDDKSTNLTKYFIDGRLYLIKDNRYNILDNIDPTTLAKYNQNLTRSLPSSKMPSHASPKRIQRSDNNHNRNFLSQNLNVNHMSLSRRPPTTTIYS